METRGGRVDKPEPRWQAVLAFVAVGGIDMALPKELVVGPAWLLPALIFVLLVPTVFAHRIGRHSLNHFLGIIKGSVTTAALVRSASLPVAYVPMKRVSPFRL